MADETNPKLGTTNVELVGTKMEFLEAPAEKYPAGVRVDFTRPGELVPFRTGYMDPGSALLYLQPDVAQHFKAAAKMGGG